MILDVDLSQIEWRVAAFLSQDKQMCADIRAGVDQHNVTCTEIMGLTLTKENRVLAKNGNFRMIFANPETSWYGYYMDSSMPDFTKSKWKTIVGAFHEKYCGLDEYHQQNISEVLHNGCLQGPTGRWWTFKKYEQKEVDLDYNTNQIRNYPIQGTSGDIIKLASIMIRQRTRHIPNQKMIMIVHDSVIFDLLPDVVEEVLAICIRTFNEIPIFLKKAFNINFNLPIDAEACIGTNWGTVEKVNI